MFDNQDGGSGFHSGKPILGAAGVGVVVLERAAELLRPSWNDDGESIPGEESKS